MSDPAATPPASERDADDLAKALHRAVLPKTAEPDIAADDGGASAAAEEPSWEDQAMDDADGDAQ